MSQQQAATFEQGLSPQSTPLRPIAATNSGFDNQPKDRSGPASVPPGTASSGRSTVAPKKANRTKLWIALALAFALAAGALAWHKSHSQKTEALPQPVDVGTVVPVPTRVQGMPDPVEQVVTEAAPAPAPEIASAASSALSSLKPVLKTTLAQVVEKVESIGETLQGLVNGQKDHEDRIGQLEGQVTQLKQQLAQATTPRRAAPHRVSVPRPVVQPAQIQSSQDESSRLLSVDVWDGKPSVAVGRNRAGTNEVRFLTEGDSNGRATVKKADVGQQRAVIATDKGEIEISRDQP